MARLWLLAMLILLFTSAAVNAVGDVVFFTTDKKPVEGKAERVGDKVVVEKADGSKEEFPASDVEQIVKGKSLNDIYFDKLGQIKVEDLDSLFDLAMWCEKVGLNDKKAVLLLTILEKDPENIRVHTYLGHVYRNGRWVNPALGEEFGDDIPDTLRADSFVDQTGKYFIVRTNTSPEFAKFISDYLDRFCEQLASHFAGELGLKPPKARPVMLILADFAQYSEHFRLCADKVLPRKTTSFLTPKDEDWQPAQHTCFLDPSQFHCVTYKYKKNPKVTSLRENVQKLAGYGLYIFCLGGFSGIYKSPRFCIEGFATYISHCSIVGNKIEAGDVPDSFRSRMSKLSDFTTSGLFAIDPLSYYNSDMSNHSLLSYSFTQFMLHGEKESRRADYFKLIKADSTNSLKVDAFKKTIRNFDKFEKEWAAYTQKL